jgi:Raf kinase inhibitor-like YbhB/YbcL family protein
MPLQLATLAFQNGGPIPAKFTGDGENVSPSLTWTEPPPATVSFVLINDDPDDEPRPWVHWLLYNIPAGVRTLKENMSKDERLPDGTLQGFSDFKCVGYKGPFPPSGTHHYVFKLYALDCLLALPPKATKPQIETAMKDHILAQTQIVGTYRRKGP